MELENEDNEFNIGAIINYMTYIIQIFLLFCKYLNIFLF